MPQAEPKYVYYRAILAPPLGELFLGVDGQVARRSENGSIEFVLRKQIHDLGEGRMFVSKVKAVAEEFSRAAQTLQEYIENELEV